MKDLVHSDILIILHVIFSLTLNMNFSNCSRNFQVVVPEKLVLAYMQT